MKIAHLSSLRVSTVTSDDQWSPLLQPAVLFIMRNNEKLVFVPCTNWVRISVETGAAREHKVSRNSSLVEPSRFYGYLGRPMVAPTSACCFVYHEK